MQTSSITKITKGSKGRLTADMITASINPDDIHRPKTRLVALENTMNKISETEEIIKIAAGKKQIEITFGWCATI